MARIAQVFWIVILAAAAAFAQTGPLEDDVRDCWIQDDRVHYLDVAVNEGDWVSVSESCEIEHCGWPEGNYTGPNGAALRFGFGYAIMATPSRATQFFGTYAWQDGILYVYDPEAYRGIRYCIRIDVIDHDPE
jgi:hypothetical protein